MRKSTFVSLCLMATLFLTIAVAPASAGSYAKDRAMIEDLQARYLFALDFRDAAAYASTFAEDGVLDYGAGELKGRKAISDFIAASKKTAEERAAKDTSGLRPAAGRHNITNIVLKVSGNKAIGRAYWFHMGNDTPKRTATFDSYGHYEDELVKVNGQWLFSKRKIYNEQVANWVAKGANPAW